MVIDLDDINLLIGKKYNVGGGTIGFKQDEERFCLLNLNCFDIRKEYSYMNIKINVLIIENQIKSEIFYRMRDNDPYSLFDLRELKPLCFSITVLPNPYILSEIFYK